MANKYYQKHKERFQKEARERYQNLSEEKKRPKKDTKFLRKKKKKKGICIIRILSTSYLSIEDIVI